MAMPPHLYSSSSTFGHTFKYDVFLSFRGSDTRHSFTGNLYKALDNRGINTFIDDEELQRGDEITSSLVRAIQESRIAIPIFSINYASSSFCLNELVNIIDCIKAKGRLVLPIFYNVDPSHVRHQIGTYGEALANHEARFNNNKKKLKDNMKRLQKWKTALNQAANLSGYHYKHGDGYEHEFIGKIIEEVSRKINRVLLPIADYPVGLESQVLEVNFLLDVGSNDGVNMVGIHGMGGSGKTTLALAVYNSIADHFEGLCFLENVRENSNRHGLQHLQNILLCEIVGEKDIKLTNVKKGISIIKHRFQQKKVLLILDDVDKQEQLQAIVGRPDWFGPGSKVIITTRDKQLLACHKVEKTYEVKELDKQDALQLLRWKAFKSEQVGPGYVDVLNRAVTYASGLPLALEVIGSNFYGKSIEEWDSALNQYAKIPNNKILEILKKSYDALEEEEKSVFLDIACCFKGYGLEEVNEMLCAHHGDNMKHHIRVLADKSLVKIVYSYNSKVTLHDLIEEMGKEIVRQESPKELGKRSRLWFYEDVVQILKHNKGSNKIEIIFLQFPFSEEENKVEWDKDAFKKMKSLKTLIIKNGYFSQGPIHLPISLRVLEWNKYPSKNLPSSFCPNKLVICKLPRSRISSLKLIGRQEFVSLTNLNFNFCEHLTQIPDVSCLRSLEILSFKYCNNLLTIHNSVGSLKKLKMLDAFGCDKLRSFPPLEMTSLEDLNLCDCTRLESFPEISVKMENITNIYLIGTPMMKEFSRSFQNLTQLTWLHLYAPLNSDWDIGSSLIERILTMPKLIRITAEGVRGWVMPKEDEGEKKVSSSNVQRILLINCKLTDEFFLVAATLFPNLKWLTLKRQNLTTVPECIKECRSLKRLELLHCTLEEIRGIPPNLKTFVAIDCPSLTASCRSMLLKQELHEAGNSKFIVPGARIPEWFEHQSEGTSLSFQFRNKLPHLLFCLVLPNCQPMPKDYCFIYLFINGIKCSLAHYYKMKSDYTTLFELKGLRLCLDEPLLENEWYRAEVIFVDQDENPIPGLIVQGGIYVLKQESSMEDIRFTNPCRKRKLEDDVDSSESQNHLLLKKHRLSDMEEAIETQIVPQQPPSQSFGSCVWNQARKFFSSFLPAFVTQSSDGKVNDDSKNGL